MENNLKAISIYGENIILNLSKILKKKEISELNSFFKESKEIRNNIDILIINFYNMTIGITLLVLITVIWISFFTLFSFEWFKKKFEYFENP